MVNPLYSLRMPVFVYILRSLKDGSYYVGTTQDVDSRVKHHNEVGTQYTKQKRPWELVYTEEHPDRSTAMQREYAIKKRGGGRQFIESLIKKSRPLNKN
jgi:putative endonuclease